MVDTFAKDALAASGAGTSAGLDAASKNATNKQYDMTLTFKITESGSGKAFYDATSVWTGTPYGVVVVTQKALVDLLSKFTDLGAAIATATPPAAKP